MNLENTKKTKFLNRSAGKSGHGQRELDLMMLPGVIFAFIFSYIPMVGIIIAFKDYKYNTGIIHSAWNGIQNFRFLFESDTFFTILRNTLGYNLFGIAANPIIATILAISLDNIGKKMPIKVFQSCMFLPYFLSWIVVSYITHSMLEYNSGFINSVIEHFGGNRISFYAEPKLWPFILCICSVWKGMGYSTLVYYGTILGIDSELYEAAAIDGCSYLKRIWHITLPHLKSTVIVLTLMSVGGIFRSDYGLFFYIPKDLGVLYSATDVLDTYILRAIRTTGNVGSASAAGALQSVVGFILVITANKIVKKLDSENSLF